MGWVHPGGGGWKGKRQNMHNVISIHACIHTYISFIHTCMHTYKHTNIETYKHTPTHRGRAHTYHTYVHACMLAHLHTDTHPPTHPQGGGGMTYNPPPPTGGGGGKSYHMKPGNPCPLGGGRGGACRAGSYIWHSPARPPRGDGLNPAPSVDLWWPWVGEIDG